MQALRWLAGVVCYLVGLPVGLPAADPAGSVADATAASGPASLDEDEIARIRLGSDGGPLCD